MTLVVPALTPLELASGLVLGFTPRPEPRVAEGSSDGSRSEVLERSILPALLRPPCLIGFSGGRGSSAVLELAVELARREGLEPPVPATWRLVGRTPVDETTRQERLIVRLGLTEWLRLEFDDELDLVGPVATAALRRQGLLWPAHAHCWVPLIEWACGGSLLTGLGHGNTFGEPALRFRELGPLPWLVPAAEADVRSRTTADAALRRRAEEHQAGWWLRLRQTELALAALRRLGNEQRVLLSSPLVDAGLTASPPLEKPSAAPLWGSHSIRLAASWEGEGVDPELVDVPGLRREWSRPRPDPRTFLLLQSVALARRAASPAEASVIG